jgi:hypothetical protein
LQYELHTQHLTKIVYATPPSGRKLGCSIVVLVTPSFPPHHFDRPKTLRMIKPQRMPWRIAFCRLLAIPKLQKTRSKKSDLQSVCKYKKI